MKLLYYFLIGSTPLTKLSDFTIGSDQPDPAQSKESIQQDVIQSFELKQLYRNLPGDLDNCKLTVDRKQTPCLTGKQDVALVESLLV